MKSKIFSLAALSLTNFFINGCGDTTGTQTAIQTKGLYPDGSQLTIRIDDNGQNNLEDSNSSNTNKNVPHVNKAPIASIVTVTDGNENNTNFVDINVGTPVLFSAKNSYDSDGNITAYIWTDMDNNILSTDINFIRTFYKAGVYEKTLTVFDSEGAYAQARVCILADYNIEDIPLIASPNADMIVTEGTKVPLRGHAVCKSGNFSYSWSENDQVLSTEQNADILLEKGEHNILFTIIDNDTGHKAFKIVHITVNPSTLSPEEE